MWTSHVWIPFPRETHSQFGQGMLGLMVSCHGLACDAVLRTWRRLWNLLAILKRVRCPDRFSVHFDASIAHGQDLWALLCERCSGALLGLEFWKFSLHSFKIKYDGLQFNLREALLSTVAWDISIGHRRCLGEHHEHVLETCGRTRMKFSGDREREITQLACNVRKTLIISNAFVGMLDSAVAMSNWS